MAETKHIRAVTSEDVECAAIRAITQRVTSKRQKRVTKMETNETPNVTTEKPQVKRKFFDLDTFNTVTVHKSYDLPVFGNVSDALAYLNNDNAKLLEVIQKGVSGIVKGAAKQSTEGWLTAEDKEYSGAPIDQKKVLTFINTIAQTVYGLDPKMSADDKKKLRAQARDYIKSQEVLMLGIKTNCLLDPNEEASEDEDEDEKDGE